MAKPRQAHGCTLANPRQVHGSTMAKPRKIHGGEKKYIRSLQGAKRLRRSFSLLRSQIRICPQMLERARHLRPLSSLLLTYFSAMTSCSQTCMIKARIASRSGAPAMLHPFGIRSFCTRPAHKMASSSCVGARKMSANARASSAFAAAFLAASYIL